VRTKFFGMVNLIAGREVVRIDQHNFTRSRVAAEAELLPPSSARGKKSSGKNGSRVRRSASLLGPPGAVFERAADEIARLLTIAPSNAN